MATQPIVGQQTKAASFASGLPEGWFDPPASEPKSSGGSSGTQTSPPEFDYEESRSSGGGGFSPSMIQQQQAMLDMAKTRSDFRRLVKQAKFFLPRTLEQIGGQYGTQGSYWSSGRRDAQQEAATKTRFDLAQAKADAEHAIQAKRLELAAASAAEQGSRSA